MNDNLIDKITSDSTYNIQYSAHNQQDTNPVFQDNDSNSSIFNLLDGEFTDKTPDDNLSPYYSMTESNNQHDPSGNLQPLAIPDIKSEPIDQRFDDQLRSKLPQIIAVEKTNIQYQVQDQNYPCLSKSFKNSFNSPVLDLLVVVLNNEKLVSFYEGYFAGIPRLASELIDLNSKYWKSLISNNDENAWECHYKSVSEKFNSRDICEQEFEVGPVIRCRLRASTKQQLFNQQFNYFFVQPCSYMVQLSPPNRSCDVYNLNDTDNVYMVSYINIMRECDTEYALKGSAAASLQKVITNSTNINRPKSETLSDSCVNNKSLVTNRARKTVNTNQNQLSINISSPIYLNPDKPLLSAPLTYPLINDQQYQKQRSQVQQQQAQQVVQHRQQIPMINNQYMARINIDPGQHHYQTHYQVQPSTSTLQYMLENRSPHYPNAKSLHNPPHHTMVAQHNQSYAGSGRANVPCYLPTDHNQSTPANCSLSSPTTFMQTRHLVPMSANGGILLSTDPYFRNGHPINVIDSVQQVAQQQQQQQPMMTVVRSLSSTLNHANNYYCSSAQSQTPIHVINSLSHQNQFSSSSTSSSMSQYCNNKNEMIHLITPPYHGARLPTTMPIKQECDDLTLSQKDWHINQPIDDPIVTTFCGPMNTLTMTNDSISFDIVEEILKAEEAKSENKHATLAMSISDNSDALSFDLDDFILLDQNNSHSTTSNVSTKTTANIPFTAHRDEQNVNREYSQQSSTSSDSLLTLKCETLEKFTTAQKIGIKSLVKQHKDGKLTKNQMLQQINDFVYSTLGETNHRNRVIEYWKTQHSSVDSTLSNMNCSHVVQSPEEGPGISPTEQAAQSTTDMEDDKDVTRHVSRHNSKKCKDECVPGLNYQRSRTKSAAKGIDTSIYNITSTTSTCVLETLLNEHDNAINSDKICYSSKLSVSSTPKTQLSLDQLLMDEECSMLTGFTPGGHDDKQRRISDGNQRQLSTANKSQPSTPFVGGNMGVLESLLNQKNPSIYGIRQKSTESILKHSKPSRQNSIDNGHEDTGNDKDNGVKKNSLLITLLNNSNGNSANDKYNMVNSSTPCSADASQPKRQRMYSGSGLTTNEIMSKKPNDKLNTGGMDVFDFEDGELNYSTTEFQSGSVTSSQSTNVQKISQAKRNRKRYYSKEMSIDSDGSSDKTSSKPSATDKKVILTSLLEARKNDETQSDRVVDNFVHPACRPVVAYDDNIDLEDIKIDDIDLEHLIDMTEPLDDPCNSDNRQTVQMSQDSVMYSDSFTTSSYDISNTAIYTMVTPVISISQSDPIVPVSKQSIIRLSEKNSILFSAIQSTLSSSSSSMNPTTVECLDNERERLLKQQQQQKVYIGGKYLGTSDVDCQPNKMSHPLSLDLLSKQMKEVGPNVMVESSNTMDTVIRPRTNSFSRMTSVMSPLGSAMMSLSPVGRTSSSSDNQADTNKLSTSTFSNVNHQQVREGLRLLVSNRSAQNNSKNPNLPRQRNSNSLNELMASPNSEFNGARTTANTKSMIHYHSDTVVSTNQKTEPSPVSYPVHQASAGLSDSKSTNILEDSLVNDVFELEELVNSKTTKPMLENTNYQNMINITRTSVEHSLASGVEQQLIPSQSDMNSSHTIASNNRPPPHHHHHLQHYHHHHQHHHRHPVPVSQPSSSESKDKPNANSTSGLLETLLSK